MMKDMFRVFGWTFVGILLVGVLLAVALPLASIISTPGRLLTKTLEVDNIVSKYEYYFDTNAQFNTRISQLKTHKKLIEQVVEPAEKSRLTMEITSIQYSCRDLANKYNMNSMKLNQTVFKDWRLPQTLEAKNCE